MDCGEAHMLQRLGQALHGALQRFGARLRRARAQGDDLRLQHGATCERLHLLRAQVAHQIDALRSQACVSCVITSF